MKLATVVLTAPRPRETLGRTLRSLDAAGFSDVGVYHDRQSSGHFRAYMAAMRHAVERRPDVDAYFLVEDDVVFCRGLHAYLQRTLWPGPIERLALCSPYSPEAYCQPQAGWDATQSERGFYLAGSQAWIFPAAIARAILADVARRETTRNADWEIGQWVCEQGRQIWYHTPSLAQHEGIGNSALGYDETGPIRVATDFVGEDYEATALLGDVL